MTSPATPRAWNAPARAFSAVRAQLRVTVWPDRRTVASYSVTVMAFGAVLTAAVTGVDAAASAAVLKFLG
jgi:preprotein translocase SecE subunit